MIDMDPLICPLCGEPMHAKSKDKAQTFRKFICSGCRSELRQPLAVKPAKHEHGIRIEEACPDCAFSELRCGDCDDPVCENHVRTIHRYLPHFSQDLRRELEETHANAIFCPLCFQAMLRRTASAKPRRKSRPPGILNPKGLFVIILMVVIVIGLRSCDQTTTLFSKSPNHEPTETTDR